MTNDKQMANSNEQNPKRLPFRTFEFSISDLFEI